MPKNNSGLIIETGTFWGMESQGRSTLLLAELADQIGSIFISIDIRPEAIKTSAEACSEYRNVIHICADSLATLKSIQSPIRFLYLDSFDFDKNKPLESQRHHLAEFEAAQSRMMPRSIILIDDCGLPHGGKGGMLEPVLLKSGWHLVMADYQKLFANFD